MPDDLGFKALGIFGDIVGCIQVARRELGARAVLHGVQLHDGVSVRHLAIAELLGIPRTRIEVVVHDLQLAGAACDVVQRDRGREADEVLVGLLEVVEHVLEVDRRGGVGPGRCGVRRGIGCICRHLGKIRRPAREGIGVLGGISARRVGGHGDVGYGRALRIGRGSQKDRTIPIDERDIVARKLLRKVHRRIGRIGRHGSEVGGPSVEDVPERSVGRARRIGGHDDAGDRGPLVVLPARDLRTIPVHEGHRVAGSHRCGGIQRGIGDVARDRADIGRPT